MEDSRQDHAEQAGWPGAPLIAPRPPGKPGLVEVASHCEGPLYNYLGPMKDQAVLAAGHNPKPSKKKVAAAMREVHDNIPSTVERADVQGAQRERMLRAIAFAKARRGT